MARYGFTLTVNAGQITGTANNLAWNLDASSFPAAAIDGGATSILNGGGNLRAYTDNTKTTRLPLEVVYFVTGVSPSVQVWGLSSLSVGSTIYVEADTVETSQPNFVDAFGRNSVWIDFEYRFHFETSGELTDSTGRYALTENGEISQVAGAVGEGSDSGYYSVIGYKGPEGFAARTHSGWFKTTGAIVGIVGYGGTVTAEKYIIRTDSGSIRHEISGSYAKTTSTAFTDGNYHSFALKTDGTVSWPSNQKISVDGIDQALTVGSTLNLNTVPTGDVEFRGGIHDPDVYDEYGLRLFATTTDRDFAEHNNQNDPASFFTVGAWEDQETGGVSITATLGTIEYSSNDTAVNLSGVIDVNTTLGAINYTSNDSVVSLSGDVGITATLGAISYSSNDTSIQISGETILTATLGAIEYSSNNTVVNLIGNVDLIATLGAINYSSNDAVVSLSGGIAVNTTLGTIDYTSNDATITLQGQVSIAATLGAITYGSNNALVNVGTGQFIGTVTAGFADDIYVAGFKQSEITVNFKS